jgi:hypothetical protein
VPGNVKVILFFKNRFLFAVLIGAAISFANDALAVKRATKYSPTSSVAEWHQDNMTVKDMEATLAKRRHKNDSRGMTQ